MKTGKRKKIVGIKEYTSASSKFISAAIAPENKNVLLGDDNNIITLWNYSDDTPISFNDTFVTEAQTCEFTRSEKYGIIGSKGGTIIIWDHRRDKITSTLKGHLNACTALGV